MDSLQCFRIGAVIQKKQHPDFSGYGAEQLLQRNVQQFPGNPIQLPGTSIGLAESLPDGFRMKFEIRRESGPDRKRVELPA